MSRFDRLCLSSKKVDICVRDRLQKFKLNIASSVVNEQNSGLDTMDTDQVLDLFDGGSPTVASQSKKSVKLSRQALLDGLADIDGDTY